MKLCNKCNIDKPFSDFWNNNGTKDKKCYTCISCSKLKKKPPRTREQKDRKNFLQRQKNAKKVKVFVSDEEKRQKRNKYMRDRRRRDPFYKAAINIRNLIKNSIYYGGFKKFSKTADILGCTFDIFIKHIESQFESWMNWDNYGINQRSYNTTWQYDHIIPISSATTIEEMLKLNHYTNIRPFCSKKNRDKWNKGTL